MNASRYFIYSLMIIVLIAVISCSQEGDPFLPGPPDAAVNFYNASEVLAFSEPFRRENAVFIDDTTEVFAAFPTTKMAVRQFPFVDPGKDPYQGMSWVRIARGNHRFMFTGPTYRFMGDTAIYMAEDRRYSLYFAESASNDNAYRIVAAEEERVGIPGKVRVRFVNLSPDAGTFRCYQSLAGGGVSTDGLPQDIGYGSVTDYVALDTTGASQTRNNIIIRLVDKNDLSRVVLTANAPAISGASFVFVIEGFRHPARRRFTYQVKDTTVTIKAGLRLNVRRTY